jgi:hypothetical protein
VGYRCGLSVVDDDVSDCSHNGGFLSSLKDLEFSLT